MKLNRHVFTVLLLCFAGTLAQKSYAISYGTNIVTNGDAELGSTAGWTASGPNALDFVISDAYFGENVQTVHGKVLELYNTVPSIEATIS